MIRAGPGFARILAAVCELFFGVVYTPLVFLGAVIAYGGLTSPHVLILVPTYYLVLSRLNLRVGCAS